MPIKDSNYDAITEMKAGLRKSKNNAAELAIAGDIVIVVSPVATTRAATTAAFNRFVKVKLQTAAGARHSWFTGTLPAAIADTSSAGTASIHGGATTVSLVDGMGVIQIDGDAAAWLSGVAQVETATVVTASGATTAGDATVIVTAAGMTGTPKTLNVALLLTDNTAALVATKIRAALAADTAVSAKFTVGGTGAAIVLTKKVKAANDTTLNVSIDNGTCAGLTTAASSADTTAGVAPETNTLTVSKNVSHALMGSVAAATSVETIV